MDIWSLSAREVFRKQLKLSGCADILLSVHQVFNFCKCTLEFELLRGKRGKKGQSLKSLLYQVEIFV